VHFHVISHCNFSVFDVLENFSHIETACCFNDMLIDTCIVTVVTLVQGSSTRTIGIGARGSNVTLAVMVTVVVDVERDTGTTFVRISGCIGVRGDRPASCYTIADVGQVSGSWRVPDGVNSCVIARTVDFRWDGVRGRFILSNNIIAGDGCACKIVTSDGGALGAGILNSG
jgi:hypothetical protein